MAEVTYELLLCLRLRRISGQKFPKRTRILSISSKPYSIVLFILNGSMIFRSFRKRNSALKSINTVHSEYSYSGVVPEKRALHVDGKFARKIPKIKFRRYFALTKSEIRLHYFCTVLWGTNTALWLQQQFLFTNKSC